MKAIFVQVNETKRAIKVTVWYQELKYGETNKYCYLTEKILRNGQKSTVKTFARVTGQEVPKIFFKKSKKDINKRSPSITTHRWRNVHKINSEISKFMKENRKETEEFLNKKFADYLTERERIVIDEFGVYILYNDVNYHHLDNNVIRFTEMLWKSTNETNENKI